VSAHPFDLTKAGFDRHVKANDLPLVVDFWAPWCGPCRIMAPAYEQAAAQLAPDARLAKLNTEAEPDVAARFGIRGIPTLIAFKDGQEVARQAGAMDLSGLLGWIKANV
jgi:thioredoxin 2